MNRGQGLLSQILVFGQRGRMKLQTVSHAPVAYAVDAGVIDESAALHHEDRHLVPNLIGAPEMSIEVSAPFDLAPRDSVVLASDELFDTVRAAWIRRQPWSGPPRERPGFGIDSDRIFLHLEEP